MSRDKTESERLIEQQRVSQERPFASVPGTNGRIWFYNDQDAWVYDPKDETGLYGQYRVFHLMDGNSVKVKGPWLSNFDALTEDTGVVVDRTLFGPGVRG